MIVVDSSVWIDQIRNTDTRATRELEAIDDTTEILVGDLVLIEVLQGMRDEASARRIERYLARFNQGTLLHPRLAIKAASNYRHLRGRGITIRSTIDVIIATFCIEHGHFLLQNDRDFQPMAEHLGLRLI